MRSPTRATAGTVLALGAAAAFLGATGCASSGSDAGRVVSAKERNERFTPATDAYTKLGYRHVWTGFPTISAGARVESLDVFDNIVAVQESAGVLSVLEADSGVTRWSDQLGNPLTKFLGVERDDGRLICTSETEAYFLDLDTGTLVGKQRLEKVGNTKPELVGDLLVYATSSGEIFGQMKGQGFRAWGASLPGTVVVNPARMGDTLGFVSSTGDVLFIDGATGAGFVRSKMYMGTLVQPAASAELMFVASQDQSLYAFSPASVAPVWRHRTNVPLRSRPTYHDGTVYCTINGEGLTAFNEFGDGGRGDIKWAAKDVNGSVIGVRAGRLLVWNGTDACLVDPANGELVERVSLPDAGLLTTDSFVDGNLYMATPDGLIVKLAPRR
jgi:outer membrane protein assembly factor BamB